MSKGDPELDQLAVAVYRVELALPNSHSRLKKRRLGELTDAGFVWFRRQANPVFCKRRSRRHYRHYPAYGVLRSTRA
jgi:hypothetical protein